MVNQNLLKSSLILLSLGGILSAISLTIGKAPIPYTTDIGKSQAINSAFEITPIKELPPEADHSFSRGTIRQWKLIARDKKSDLILTTTSVTTQSSDDLSVDKITLISKDLKELHLVKPKIRSLTGSGFSAYAVGRENSANGLNVKSTAQTCIPIIGKHLDLHGTGVNHVQLTRRIASINNEIAPSGAIGKFLQILGLKQQPIWSCLFVSIGSSGSKEEAEESLIDALKVVIDSLSAAPGTSLPSTS